MHVHEPVECARAVSPAECAGGVYLLYLRSFAFMYRYILYMQVTCLGIPDTCRIHNQNVLGFDLQET
jgi:hypothetical protein